MVGPTGKVMGNINANEVCVMGEITGDLHVKDLAKIGSTGIFKETSYQQKSKLTMELMWRLF